MNTTKTLAAIALFLILVGCTANHSTTDTSTPKPLVVATPTANPLDATARRYETADMVNFMKGYRSNPDATRSIWEEGGLPSIIIKGDRLTVMVDKNSWDLLKGVNADESLPCCALIAGQSIADVASRKLETAWSLSYAKRHRGEALPPDGGVTISFAPVATPKPHPAATPCSVDTSGYPGMTCQEVAALPCPPWARIHLKRCSPPDNATPDTTTPEQYEIADMEQLEKDNPGLFSSISFDDPNNLKSVTITVNADYWNNMSSQDQDTQFNILLQGFANTYARHHNDVPINGGHIMLKDLNGTTLRGSFI